METQYTDTYLSAVGEIILSCDDAGLTGLDFRREKPRVPDGAVERDEKFSVPDGAVERDEKFSVPDGAVERSEEFGVPDRAVRWSEKPCVFDGAVGRGEREHPILRETRRWLDLYFSGKNPGFLPPLHMTGSPFRMEVWKLLLEIPYGETTTYGEIARTVAKSRGIEKMSAQAVGGAVGHNKIGIIVPCHRVVGTNGSLTGYASGIDRKVKLLALEGADMSSLFVPTKGTAL